jgi:hypothetical protein
MKFKEIKEGSTDIQYPDYDDNESEVKEAFLAGYSEGERAGFNDASDLGTNETPEEAYAYWLKYDKEGE